MGPRRSGRGGRGGLGERGSAIAEFAMVSALVAVLALGVLQVGLTLYVRNVLIACASEGARLGARADAQPDDGAQRARELITRSVSERFARHVTVEEAVVDGVWVVVVHVVAPMPVVGMLGVEGALDVTGRAFLERQ
jgi:Flp pilus assembly protein TadG